MIKGIIGRGHVIVDGGTVQLPYFNHKPDHPSCGAMRVNANSQEVEVFTGIEWASIPAIYPTVHLDATAQTILDWAEGKMNEEKQLEILAKKYLTIKDLMVQRDEINSKINMVRALVTGKEA